MRLPTYDYRSGGCYFVTINSFRRQPLFGSIGPEGVCLSPLGRLVASEIEAMPARNLGVVIDTFIVMPDHIHLLLALPDGGHRTLGWLINAFKAGVTRQCRVLLGDSNMRVWGNRYHEHVVRSVDAIEPIRRYVLENPARWWLRMMTHR